MQAKPLKFYIINNKEFILNSKKGIDAVETVQIVYYQ